MSREAPILCSNTSPHQPHTRWMPVTRFTPWPQIEVPCPGLTEPAARTPADDAGGEVLNQRIDYWMNRTYTAEAQRDEARAEVGSLRERLAVSDRVIERMKEQRASDERWVQGLLDAVREVADDMHDPLRGKSMSGGQVQDALWAILTTADPVSLADVRDDDHGLQDAIDAMVGELHELLDDCSQTGDQNAAVKVAAVRETLARYRVTTEQVDDTDWAEVARAQQEMDTEAVTDHD